MNSKEDIYNIDEYSDEELYQILDLNDPTDRELEAKILMMIHKYESSNAKSSKKLAYFFEQIYNHFFEDSDDEETLYEGQTNLTTEQDEYRVNLDASLNLLEEQGLINYDVSINKLSDASLNEIVALQQTIEANPAAYDPRKTFIQQNQNVLKEDATETNKLENSVGYTKELTYTQGSLNPILKQTKKRIISIDSQYRVDKRTFPTEFTFNLSEPLRDVVSLKLYSVQIPYTWYTISKTYGSNFFYIKGNAAGINNSLHDIQIDISAGNYTPSELAIALNQAIAYEKEIYTDTNFNNTDISYNRFTSLNKVRLDVDKIFNENSYSISFPVNGVTDASLSPYLNDASRNTNIPSYLGLQTTTYYPNVIRTSPGSTPDATTNFTFTDANKFFSVYKYTGTSDFNVSTSTVDLSFDISFSLTAGTYTREQLVTDISGQISNHYYLTDSFIKRTNVETYNDSTDSFYELKINPNRLRCENKEESKMAVVFSGNENEIWYGTNSCFGFDKQIYEVNDIIGEKQAIAQTDTFLQQETGRNDQIHVNLTPNIPQFIIPDSSINDISFGVLYTTTGYSKANFVKQINSTIASSKYSSQLNYNFDNSGIDFNTQSQDPSGTYAYVDTDNRFTFQFDVAKDISMTNYQIELSGMLLANFFTDSEQQYSKFENLNSTMIIDDFTQINTIDNVSDRIYTITTTEPLFSVKTKSTAFEILTGDLSDCYDIFAPTEITFSTYDGFKKEINKILTEYRDPYSNLSLFTSENTGTDENGNIQFLTSIASTSNPDVSLNITVSKKLSAKNFNLQLMDISGSSPLLNEDFNGTNTWRDSLNLDASACYISFNDNKFDLSYALPTTGLTTLTNSDGGTVATIDPSGIFDLKGLDIIPVTNLITIIDGVNNTINITGIENGVASTGGENDITLTITPGSYSRTGLLDIINTQIALYNDSNTTKVSGRFELTTINNLPHLNINLTILRKYLPKDFNIVFFDEISFAQCSSGYSSVRNTTWDSTLGWVLGFREFTIYDMGAIGQTGTADMIQIEGDTGISTNLYNYFLLCIDDYNQNHLNDGLVTITNRDTSIPLPSYASRADFQCDPVTGNLVYNTTTGLTQSQIYAATEIANSKNQTSSIGTSISAKSYGTGPFVKDVFGLVPLKVSGLASGSTFSEFGGTLQNQERTYFGPVNIQRMTVRLVTDRGDLVDLNNANWSFSLIAEQLNKLNP